MPWRKTGTSWAATVPAVTGTPGAGVCAAAAAGTSVPWFSRHSTTIASSERITTAPIARLTIPSASDPKHLSRREIYHRQTIRVTRSRHPWNFCRRLSLIGREGAEAVLSAQWRLYRGTIRASRHQAIFDAGALSELSDENHPGNRQRQDDDQPDQRRRPSLVGSVLAVLGSIIHRPVMGLLLRTIVPTTLGHNRCSASEHAGCEPGPRYAIEAFASRGP